MRKYRIGVPLAAARCKDGMVWAEFYKLAKVTLTRNEEDLFDDAIALRAMWVQVVSRRQALYWSCNQYGTAIGPLEDCLSIESIEPEILVEVLTPGATGNPDFDDAADIDMKLEWEYTTKKVNSTKE